MYISGSKQDCRFALVYVVAFIVFNPDTALETGILLDSPGLLGASYSPPCKAIVCH